MNVPNFDESHAPAQNHPADNGRGEPDPSWVRGTCPKCGAVVVSNLYYVARQGYRVRWECWQSIGKNPTCDFGREL